MDVVYQIVVVMPAVLLLIPALISNALANRHLPSMRRFSASASAAALAMALVAAGLLVARGPLDSIFVSTTSPLPLSFGVYFDSLAAVMTVLISSIGFVIVRYSLNYLEGESTQGRFLRWIMVTLGSVMLMVVSRNLVMFTALWMMTSFSLHQLLTHYPERTWGIWAARKKFLISRLGDAFLIAALWLTWNTFGSLEFAQLFAAAQSMHDSGTSNGMTTLIGVLFAIGAMTKSAQVPFHSWLPDTMEMPTPVSALMHAGIINAGGFLVIRLSPLVTLSQLAMDLLLIVGAVTAVMGAVVMMTQTSIKRSLAYSTIAQMGFMMLQCGLGAFSVALLHIIAHAAYKAHAFLSCGSVLDRAAKIRVESTAPIRSARLIASLLGSVAIAFIIAFGASWLFGKLIEPPPGKAMLAVILSLALAQLLWTGAQTWAMPVFLRAVGASLGVTIAYYSSLALIDSVLGASVSHHVTAASPWHSAIVWLVGAGFVAIFALVALAMHYAHAPVVQRLYLHAANAFYLETAAQRMTAWIYRKPLPRY